MNRVYCQNCKYLYMMKYTNNCLCKNAWVSENIVGDYLYPPSIKYNDFCRCINKDNNCKYFVDNSSSHSQSDDNCLNSDEDSIKPTIWEQFKNWWLSNY